MITPDRRTDFDICDASVRSTSLIKLCRKTVLICCAFLWIMGIPSAGQLTQEDRRSFDFVFRVNGFTQETYFGEPSALALDEKSGVFWLADSKYGEVYSFSLQGVPKTEYGADKGIETPVGLAVDKNGVLYVAEKSPGPIKVIGRDGAVKKLEIPSPEKGEPTAPGRMKFDRNGSLYVVDRANCRIAALDAEGKVRLTVGAKGDKRGQFKALQDVAVDRQGRIYALDSEGTPVQVFDKNGKYIYRFGFHGDGLEDISYPSGIFVDGNDQIWVTDRGRHALKVFDRSGTFLRALGKYGVEEGYLFQPADSVMDGLGRVYIAEAGARRMQIFSLSRPFEPFVPQGL